MCARLARTMCRSLRRRAPSRSDLRDAEFHFIGHLQTNKARQCCGLFQVVQTVDSVRLVQKLDEAAREQQSNRDVLFEIKISDEQSKTGASPEALPELLAAAEKCVRLRLLGLMTMPPWSEDAEQSRPVLSETCLPRTQVPSPSPFDGHVKRFRSGNRRRRYYRSSWDDSFWGTS